MTEEQRFATRLPYGIPGFASPPAHLYLFLRIGQVGFCSPAPRSTLENMAVVQESIEHGGDGGAVAEHFAESSTGRFEVTRVLARS